MDLLGSYPGIPGLFVACVYSAALSTVSSGLNSLAAVCLKDFIQPMYKIDQLSERRATNISRLLGNTFYKIRSKMIVSKFVFFFHFKASTFGILIVGLAFLCQFVGATVLQISFVYNFCTTSIFFLV